MANLDTRPCECSRYAIGDRTDLRKYYGLQFTHLQNLQLPVLGTILAKRCYNTPVDRELYECLLLVEYPEDGVKVRNEIAAKWAAPVEISDAPVETMPIDESDEDDRGFNELLARLQRSIDGAEATGPISMERRVRQRRDKLSPNF